MGPSEGDRVRGLVMALVLSLLRVDMSVFLLKSSLESGPCNFRPVPDLAWHLSQKIKPCLFSYRTPNCTIDGAGGRVSVNAGLFLPDGVASKGTLQQLHFCFIFSLYYDFSSKNNISSME